MTMVIARDATAADHLVYAWPFPLGPEEIEVSCGEEEIVVMCPSWLVGDRLGPGRHRWRTPDPTRPVGAYFVSMAPVETSFDVTTSFVIPATQQSATLRAQGSIIVRCVDPGLLIAQFVGLPFDNVNDGLLRSVTRSSERLVARVLTRRTVMAQTVVAVTDPGMMPSIVEELVAYNPAAGAVFGVEFVRVTGLYVTTGDGAWATGQLEVAPDWSPNGANSIDAQGSAPRYIPMEPTKQGVGPAGVSKPDPMTTGVVSGEIGTPPTAPTGPLRQEDITTPGILPVASGQVPPGSAPGLVPPPPAAAGPAKEENLRSTMKSHAVPPPERQGSNPGVDVAALTPRATTPLPPVRTSSGSITLPAPTGAPAATQPPPPQPAPAPAAAAPPPTPLPPITPPLAASSAISRTKSASVPGLSPSLAAIMPRPRASTPVPTAGKPAGAGDVGAGKVVGKTGGATPSDGVPLPVMGIGMGGIGVGGGRVGEASSPTSPRTSEDEKAMTGEIVEKLDKGSRVLVPGADGRLVSATIRQEQAGYYELEIGGSGETLWVPRANVKPEE